MTTEKPAAPLSTSDGARCYIAHFFAREMRRHDFATYIATELAADFACALAQHLAARQPGAQMPIGSIDPRHLVLMKGRSGTFSGNIIRVGDAMQPGDALLYAAPPAQGIDLGQLERIRNELHAMSGQVPDEWLDPIVELQQDVQKLIDSQRAAAPGVGNG